MKLYKRNAKGNPLVWFIEDNHNDTYNVSYGIVGKNLHKETVYAKRKNNEIQSRIKAKRKEGYKELSELKDNNASSTIIENLNNKDLIDYLNLYLPKHNTTSEGFILPMLAKTLDSNRPFEQYGSMLGQYKINGLRCIIGAKQDYQDMFNPIKLTYHSREGVEWNLSWMDELILPNLDNKVLELMLDEGAYLDGELYLPGYTVNDIDSFVKNPKMLQHKLLQYWCYDICVENMTAYDRDVIRRNYINATNGIVHSKNDHLNFKSQFVLVPTFTTIDDIVQARHFRDKFIDLGFEGLICRKIHGEYQFGKRNSAMFKYKRIDDGLFTITDIVPEGKRQLAKFICKNDINSELFKCSINKNHSTQEYILANKDLYIGKQLLVEYRERSGVNQLPFHARGVEIIL